MARKARGETDHGGRPDNTLDFYPRLRDYGAAVAADIRVIWTEGYPDLVNESECLEHDLELLMKMEQMWLEQGSGYFECDGKFLLMLRSRQLCAMFQLSALQIMTGSANLDRRVLRDFWVNARLSKTRALLREAGAGPQVACIGAAACAVHLGAIPATRFGMGKTEISDLHRHRNAQVRRRVAQRVEKRCLSYEGRVNRVVDYKEDEAVMAFLRGGLVPTTTLADGIYDHILQEHEGGGPSVLDTPSLAARGWRRGQRYRFPFAPPGSLGRTKATPPSSR